MKILGKKDIAGARISACEAVEQASDEVRKRLSSGSSVLAAVYRAKVDEAKFVIAGGNEEEAVLLKTEADARGVSALELARAVISADADWRQKMGDVEARRFAVKGEIYRSNCIETINKMAVSFAQEAREWEGKK